jgi:hypothetical protein
MADLEAIVAGIDYGSRSSGNTIMAWSLAGGNVSFFRPEKGLDADVAVFRVLTEMRPATVGIDAPLSLPGRYRDLPGCSDYFYRHCDRELKAMSPMFLGGLTARAMRLSDQMRETGVFRLRSTRLRLRIACHCRTMDTARPPAELPTVRKYFYAGRSLNSTRQS